MGEEFYVMISGTTDVIIEGPGKVHQYDGTAAFGELSLMYNAPRAATIQATSDCAVFSLEKKAFRYILTQTASSSLVQKSKFLKNVPLLAGFSDHMINKIASALEEEQFEENSYIIRQGEAGEKFYMIQEGFVKCTKAQGAGQPELDLITLSTSAFFGELALLNDAPRAANCIAVDGPVLCYTLSREEFNMIFGSMDDVKAILAQQMKLRVLKSVPLLIMLNESEIEAVAAKMESQTFSKGQEIVKEGKKGDKFFIVNEGEVAAKKGGKELTRLRLSEYVH